MASMAQAGRSPNADGGGFTVAADTPSFAAKHYTVAEIASLWSLSDDAVRKIFEREPGVLVLANQSGKYRKRRYTTLRIPEFVLERVHKRLSKV